MTDVTAIDKTGGLPQITTGEDGRLETSGHVLFTQTQSTMTDDTSESLEGRPLSLHGGDFSHDSLHVCSEG